MSVCFEVDTDVLRRDTLTLRQYLSIISHAHGNLRDKMMEVNGMWEGPAKEAFHAQFKEDCAELINLCKQMYWSPWRMLRRNMTHVMAQSKA